MAYGEYVVIVDGAIDPGALYIVKKESLGSSPRWDQWIFQDGLKQRIGCERCGVSTNTLPLMVRKSFVGLLPTRFS